MCQPLKRLAAKRFNLFVHLWKTIPEICGYFETFRNVIGSALANLVPRGLSILSVLSPKRDDLSSFETLKLRGHLWPKIPGSLIASSCFPKEFAFCMAG